MHWCSQQQGLTRYNCADSLDRTNIASFFISVQVRLSLCRILSFSTGLWMQVFVEQCRRLELAVLTRDDEMAEEPLPRTKPTLRERLFGGLLPGSATSQSPSQNVKPSWPAPTGRSHRRPKVQFRQALPVGWEARVDEVSGCTYYIDHVNKRTTWSPPPDDTETAAEGSRSSLESKKSFRVVCKEEILSKEAWSMLNSTVEEIRRKVLPEALTSIADVFLQNGDRNAFFYTGSQAMHSDKIMIFEPQSSQLKKNTVSGASNSFIAITRRYNNIIKDNDRQAQIELFLGINLEKYFLSSTSAGRDLDSVNVVYKPKQLEQDIPDTDDEQDPVNSIDYPSLGRTTVAIQPTEAAIDTRRSASSPNLPRFDYSTQSFDAGNAVQTVDDQIQMYSFEDAIHPQATEKRDEDVDHGEGVEPSAAANVASLRELSVSHDPLVQ